MCESPFKIKVPEVCITYDYATDVRIFKGTIYLIKTKLTSTYGKNN